MALDGSGAGAYRDGICSPSDTPQGLGRGYFVSGCSVPAEPPAKRAVAFIDAQNRFHAAKEAFGYRRPNFDPLKLARAITRPRGANPRYYVILV